MYMNFEGEEKTLKCTSNTALMTVNDSNDRK